MIHLKSWVHAYALEFRNFKRVWTLCYNFSLSRIVLFLPLGSNDCQQFPCSLEVILYEFNQWSTLLSPSRCYAILSFTLIFVIVLSSWQKRVTFLQVPEIFSTIFFFIFKTYSIPVQLQSTQLLCSWLWPFLLTRRAVLYFHGYHIL